MRPLALAALAGLTLAALVGVADAALPGAASLRLHHVHGLVSVHAFLLPALAAFTAHALERLVGRTVPRRKGTVAAALWLAGTVVLALATVLDPPSPDGDGVPTPALANVLGLLGLAVLVGAAGMTTGILLKAVPKRKESVVDVQRDPLTKGDDASLAHLRFAQVFLPLGVLLDAASRTASFGDTESGLGDLLRLSGIHLLAVHALVSCYGLAHLWVPRLSGVPAIAAGAIKGELHSTLLGTALLFLGFFLDDGAAPGTRGLRIAGGAFLFLGAFTFMGVIGANIMRNKSRTQRVTPEFTYIPWAFTAVFWLLSGVLLGIFLNVVPDVYEVRAWSLRFTHIHIAFLGGVGQLLLALAWRLVPAQRGSKPPPFHGAARAGFFALNGGLVLMLLGHFQAYAPDAYQPRLDTPLFLAGSALVVLGVAASFFILARHGRIPGTRPA